MRYKSPLSKRHQICLLFVRTFSNNLMTKVEVDGTTSGKYPTMLF